MTTPLILLCLILYFFHLLSHNTAIASLSTNNDYGGNIYPGGRKKRFAQPDVIDPILPPDLVYPTSMAYEESFLRKMGSKTAAEEYIEIVVDLAQDRLKDESLGSKLHLDVKQKPRFLPNKWLNVDDESLDESYLIPSNESLVIFVYDNDTDVEMGNSIRAAGCDSVKRKIILKWRSIPLKVGIVLAHEYGHLALGMFHDDQEDDKIKHKITFFNVSGHCDSGNTMMNTLPLMNGSLPIWSECSRLRLQKYYNQSGHKCLEKELPSSIPIGWIIFGVVSFFVTCAVLLHAIFTCYKYRASVKEENNETPTLVWIIGHFPMYCSCRMQAQIKKEREEDAGIELNEASGEAYDEENEVVDYNEQ